MIDPQPVRVVGWDYETVPDGDGERIVAKHPLILAHDESDWLIDLVNKHGKVSADVNWHDLAKKFIDELLYHAKMLRGLK